MLHNLHIHDHDPRPHIIGVQLQHAVGQMMFGGKIPFEEEHEDFIEIRDRGERIQILRDAQLFVRFRETSASGKRPSISRARLRTRAEIDRSPEFRFRARPIPIPGVRNRSEQSVRLAKRGVDVDRFLRGLFGCGDSLLWRDGLQRYRPDFRASNSNICGGKRRIFRDRCVEKIHGFF